MWHKEMVIKPNDFGLYYRRVFTKFRAKNIYHFYNPFPNIEYPQPKPWLSSGHFHDGKAINAHSLMANI